MQGSPACLRSVASGPVPVQNSIPRNSIPGVVSARRPEDAAPPSWRRPGACSDGATRPAVAIPDDGIERRLNHIGAAMKPPVGFLLQAAARPGRRRPHQTPARLRSRFSASQRKGKQPLQWRPAPSAPQIAAAAGQANETARLVLGWWASRSGRPLSGSAATRSLPAPSRGWLFLGMLGLTARLEVAAANSIDGGPRCMQSWMKMRERAARLVRLLDRAWRLDAATGGWYPGDRRRPRSTGDTPVADGECV